MKEKTLVHDAWETYGRSRYKKLGLIVFGFKLHGG